MRRAAPLPLLLFAWFIAAPHCAAAEPDPLRLVPDSADLVIQLRQPRKTLELGVGLASMQELRGFNQYRELFDSTAFNRFQQLVAHFEKELGAPWPELVDRLAGGGIVAAVRTGEGNQPAMLVVQGRDAALTRRFLQAARNVLQQELARQESKDEIKETQISGVEVLRVGDGLLACALDDALVLSNVDRGVAAAIELHQESKKVRGITQLSRFKEARQHAHADCLAWGWLNLERVRQAPNLQDLQKFPGPLSPLYVFIGGWLDVARRAPYATASLRLDASGRHVLGLSLPRGTDDMPAVLARMHAPPPGQPGVLPPLMPPGTLFSHSFYLDLHEFWQKRDRILTGEQLDALEEANKAASPFLLATRFGDIIDKLGARHRLVATTQAASGYKTVPLVRIPSLAFVGELSDPEGFSQKVEPPLRAIGLLAALNVKMTYFEEKHGQHRIVGYRFAEDQANRDVANGILFNFSPCFVRVGDKFILSTTLELARSLVEELEKEKASPSANLSAAQRTSLGWQGVGAFLGSFREQLVTQIILQDGVGRADAEQQIQSLLDFLGRLGGVEGELVYGTNSFTWNFTFVPPAGSR